MKKIGITALTGICLLGLAACSSKEVTGGSDSSEKSSAVSQSESSLGTRDNTATQVTLEKGEWTVGDHIEPGTYVITSLEGTGNLTSNLTTDAPKIDTILTHNRTKTIRENGADGALSVSSYRAILKEGEKLKMVLGLSKILCEPAPDLDNMTRGRLHAGTYIVGVDIEPGTYEITCVEGAGGLSTSDEEVSEFMDDGKYTGDQGIGEISKSVSVTLKEGQKLTSESETISIERK